MKIVVNCDKQSYDFNMINALEYNVSKQQRIEQIAKILSDFYGIKFLAYKKFLPNGNMLYINIHSKFRDFSFQNKCWHTKEFEINYNKIMSKPEHIYIWPEYIPKNDIARNKMSDYNIKNGAMIFKKNSNSFEGFAFYSDYDATNFYLNEKDILDRFILYFKEQAYDIINNRDKRLWIPTTIKLCDAVKLELKNEILNKK